MGRVRWKVSLSNGRTFYEGKGNFEFDPTGLSPWNKLLEYVRKNDLKITSASLYTDDGRNYHVPSSGTNPRFPFFDQVGKPKDYHFFHALTSARMGPDDCDKHYVVIEAQYEDYKLQMWVDDQNHDNCWCLCMKN